MEFEPVEVRYIGATSKKIEVEFFNETTNQDIDLTGVTAICQFRFGGKSGDLKIEMTIGDGLSIPTPTNGIIEIDAIDEFDWAEGDYYFDMRLTFTDNTDSYWARGILPVKTTVTKV